MGQNPYKYFRIEAQELLGSLSRSLIALEKGQPANAEVTGIMRAMHTLKGAARVVRQAAVADLCHSAETVLAPFRETTPPKAVVQQLLSLVDQMDGCLRSLPGQDQGPQVEAPSTSAPTSLDPMRSVRVEIAEIDRLCERVAEGSVHLGGLARQLAEIDEVTRELADASETLAGRRPVATAGLRTLIDRNRSLLEGVRRSIARDLGHAERKLGDAQERGRGMRLVAAGGIFLALERAAHDAASSLGRAVEFNGVGGDVRLDAHVLDGVRDMLLHLVRNAVAHGIEPEPDRRAAGKQARGRIHVEVERHGHRASFVCEDDGAGLDLGAIRRAVIARGILPVAAAEQLDLEGALRLLFRGGISTAPTINPIAGRGVGLDAVAAIARRLRATVNATSAPGRGTRVQIDVPVSLASGTILHLEAGGTRAALPLAAVQAVTRVLREQLLPTEGGLSLLHAGEALPFIPLDEIFGGGRPSRTQTAWSVVIVADGATRLALGCSRILGTGELVMKPLPEVMGHVFGVTGAALDATGEPQLVLDPHTLLEAAAKWSPPAPRHARSRPRILVIDDSLTTRLIEQGILEAAGYIVDTVGSAEEGLERAKQQSYALFVVDIELPGKDGFSFIEETRAHAVLGQIPAVIVTSRDSPTDRSHGVEAGAVAYIVKRDFDEPGFIGRIEALIAR